VLYEITFWYYQLAFEEGWIDKQLDKARADFESLPPSIKDLFKK